MKTQQKPEPYSTKSKTAEIDLHLAIAAKLNHYGDAWSLHELGRYCNASHEAFRIMERKALRRVKKLWAEQGGFK